MRNLILVLVAFIAIVTFIRAYDAALADSGEPPGQGSSALSADADSHET
jgi:hypothetical protein